MVLFRRIGYLRHELNEQYASQLPLGIHIDRHGTSRETKMIVQEESIGRF
jgi:hypothetical protein